MPIDPSRIVSTAAWREQHDPHRTLGVDHVREDAGHPSGEWIRLRCTCGAAHLTTITKADAEAAS